MPDDLPTAPESAPRLFAVVPAAGRSRRMGRPKLLLPWGDHTVIEQVLGVLRQAGCTSTTVVVRPDDADLRKLLGGGKAGCELVVPPFAPPHMRDSVEYALAHISQSYHPAPHDAWLLVPADHPTIHPEWINALRDARRTAPDCILVPTHNGRRGHPVLFPWPLAAEVVRLPPGTGINAVLRQRADRVHEVPVAHSTVLTDLDTPQDYRRQHDEPPRS